MPKPLHRTLSALFLVSLLVTSGCVGDEVEPAPDFYFIMDVLNSPNGYTGMALEDWPELREGHKFPHVRRGDGDGDARLSICVKLPVAAETRWGDQWFEGRIRPYTGEGVYEETGRLNGIYYENDRSVSRGATWAGDGMNDGGRVRFVIEEDREDYVRGTFAVTTWAFHPEDEIQLEGRFRLQVINSRSGCNAEAM